MNCTNAIHEISTYIDGELEATVRIQLEEHFRECEGCATIVRQTEVTIRIFSSHQPVGYAERRSLAPPRNTEAQDSQIEVTFLTNSK